MLHGFLHPRMRPAPCRWWQSAEINTFLKRPISPIISCMYLIAIIAVIDFITFPAPPIPDQQKLHCALWELHRKATGTVVLVTVHLEVFSVLYLIPLLATAPFVASRLSRIQKQQAIAMVLCSGTHLCTAIQSLLCFQNNLRWRYHTLLLSLLNTIDRSSPPA